jgi:hypothetical protein
VKLPRRRWILLAAVTLVVALGWGAVHLAYSFPSETTPQGAYLRIAIALGSGTPGDGFAYLEEEAQVACHTIHGYARQAAAAIRDGYPEPERGRALARYQSLAEAADAPELWGRLAAERGWLGRLRRDLSGVSSVEVVGERATVVTARGTRYAFRRRPNGIWGLTLFTAALAAEARRLARDWDLIRQAAADYARARPH